MADPRYTKLQIPEKNPYNIQAVKRYIFNETGNIMLASTEIGSETIADSVRDVFAEVSVFFAAMTKAISTTINPVTKEYYSLYNYTAIQNVIDGSGLFVHVTEEDIEHQSTSFGVTFSKELIEGLLGLASGVGELEFAQAMIASMGEAGLKIGGSHSSSDSKVANIIFVCEYLLGMPIVSAIVVYCDSEQVKTAWQAGPCFKGSTTSTTLKMHKDTYMFVTPKFIKQYSGDLLSVTTDQEYLEFVDYLQNIVEGQPIITAVQVLGDTSGASAPSNLTIGTTYVMLGAFLDDKGNSGDVKVGWVDSTNNSMKGEIANAEIQSNLISFSPQEKQTTPMAIGVFFKDSSTKKPEADPPPATYKLAVATPSVYTAGAGS